MYGALDKWPSLRRRHAADFSYFQLKAYKERVLVERRADDVQQGYERKAVARLAVRYTVDRLDFERVVPDFQVWASQTRRQCIGHNYI